MKDFLFGTLVALLVGIAVISEAQAPPKSAQSKALETQAPVAMRPIPAEMKRRVEAMQLKLQPSARSWIEQQARIEAKRPAPDLPGLDAAVRQRFANSNKNLSDADMNAIVFVVLMQSVQDGEGDLQNMMNQMQAINSQKQALRQLADETNRDAAQNAKQNGSAQCASALCKSLPGRLANLRAATSKMPHPVSLQAPERLTYGDLARIQAQLQGAVNSMNESSETQSLELQMTMDRRSKLIDTLSNVLKKISDTSDSVVQNLK
ncbi:MAG: hypothetical protein WAM91_14700 [Candidatus Acidiferrales bacterium]